LDLLAVRWDFQKSQNANFSQRKKYEI